MDAEPSIERRIAVALFASVRGVGAEIRRAGASAQLTVPQFAILRLLAGGDLPVGDVARGLRVAMPTVTQTTDSLAGKGLIERYSDERDRRQVRLRITAEGRRLLQHCEASIERYLAVALARWPVGRKRELADALEEMGARCAPAPAGREG